jgi:predicted DNA binding CopG/RHH family protein
MSTITETLPPLLTRQDFASDDEYREYLEIEGADYDNQPAASDAEVAYWKALADEHIGGAREKISLNVPKRNLSRLKARALEQGLPYQTLINAVLQQWIAKQR